VPLDVVEPGPVVPVVPVDEVEPAPVVEPGPVADAPPMPVPVVVDPALQETTNARQQPNVKEWKTEMLGPKNFMARHGRVTYLQPQAQGRRARWGTM
jgi:hypothetical protein